MSLRAVLLTASFLVIAGLPGLSQSSSAATAGPIACPSPQPGIFLQNGSSWQQLKQTAPTKMKAKHAVLSSFSYGAVAAPMVVEYAGQHATIQTHTARPQVCVVHIMSSGDPILVRLTVKKQNRELDSGSVRAVPFTDASTQGHASASSLVPVTVSSHDGDTTILPQQNLAPGEYAVMFGAQNLGILDFGVAATQ